MTSNQPRPRTRLSLRSNSVHYDSLSTEQPDSDTPFMRTNPISQKRSYIAVAVLCYINLLNYMDRYTIAGVLLSIQNYFGIPDSTSGLLQTVFICSFMFLAPIFGYLGDRYNRKIIMIAGMIVWIITTLGSSFVKKSDFWVLVLTRALVGTGEASYSTIAPTIIGDLFTGTKRTLMISFFYIFIPVGSGLGYILGATIANATGDWRWALRSDWSGRFGEGKNRESESEVEYHHTVSSFSCESYIFGAITVVTGIVGVFLGTYISKQLRDRLPNADPLICAVGMLSSSPCFFIAIILAATSIPATYTFIAIGETLLSLNWAILADILLYVVVPTRRATAEALQIMVCHLLGDAGSPYLIGAISDALLKYDQESPHWDFRRLEYSILLCPIIGILGGVFFFMTSLYIKEDRKAAELLNSGNNVLL
uniref:Spinster homolog 3 (Drosophila) n=1 Tax=Cyprinus carpio TaxID=7962 RepID=A0A8C2EBW2_CYPCA